MQALSQKLQLGGSFVPVDLTGPFSKIACGPFQQNRLFNKFVIFSNKIVDLFDKIMDL